MKLVMGSSCGAKKRTLLMMYRTLVRPVLEYGLEAVQFAPLKYSKILQKVQSSSLRICCGAMRSTPLCVLQVSCNEMPLCLRWEYLCSKFRNKILSTIGHPCKSMLQYTWEEEWPRQKHFKTFRSITEPNTAPSISKAQDDTSASLQAPPWTLDTPEADLRLIDTNSEFPQLRFVTAMDHIDAKYSSFQHIYTDGSKTHTATGSAFYVPSLQYNQSRIGSPLYSSFTAELEAIRMALNWALLEHQQDIVILSDCLSAISAIKAFHENRNFVVTEIINLVKDFKLSGRIVVFAWIPSHCGIPGNEKADRIARTTANGTHNGPITLTRTEANKWIFSIIKQKWNREYLKIPTGQHFKNFFPTVFQADNLGDKPTRYHRIVFRLRTGHCRLNQHLFKIGVTDSPLCNYCKSEETVSHFLMFCSKFRFERRLITKAVRAHAISFTLKNILTDHRVLDATVEFAIASQRQL